MARSSGGGSRSGGSRGGSHHSSSHRSSSGSRHHHSSGSSISRSRRYSSHCRHRHYYVDRRGRSRTYYTSMPFNFSMTPFRYGLSRLPKMIFMAAMFLLTIGFITVENFKYLVACGQKLDAYHSGYAVIEDTADVFTDSEEQSLERVLRQFGEDTGIIPYVYTSKDMTIEDFTYTDAEKYSMEMYYKLFHDEDHFLITYIDASDWQWWGIQGDNTYPLLGDSEYEDFREDLQHGFYSSKTKAQALEDAFDGFGKKVADLNVATIVRHLAPNIIMFLLPVAVILVPVIIDVSRYAVEYRYYQQHGLPTSAENILDTCPGCGASNTSRGETCEYCGRSLIR